MARIAAEQAARIAAEQAAKELEARAAEEAASKARAEQEAKALAKEAARIAAERQAAEEHAAAVRQADEAARQAAEQAADAARAEQRRRRLKKRWQRPVQRGSPKRQRSGLLSNSLKRLAKKRHKRHGWQPNGRQPPKLLPRRPARPRTRLLWMRSAGALRRTMPKTLLAERRNSSRGFLSRQKPIFRSTCLQSPICPSRFHLSR